MKQIILFFLITFTLEASYNFTLSNSNEFDERVAGFWKSKETSKAIFISKQNVKTIALGMYTFLEVKEGKKFSLFRYLFDENILHLQEVNPSFEYTGNEVVDKYIVQILDSKPLFKMCDLLDYSSQLLCRRAEVKRIEQQLTQESYQQAMQYYLLRYGERYTMDTLQYIKQKDVQEFPNSLYNTEQTSLSIVEKTEAVFAPDYEQTKEVLWFLSIGNSTVNIFINGLDFHDATYKRHKRHLTNIETWKAYYKNDALKDNFNVVYSWDPAFGIERKNTFQLEMFISHILKNNPHNKINIIAHSHGGNLAKETLIKLYDNNINLKNITLVTLGTPHKGIAEITSASKVIMPAVEIIYNVFNNFKSPSHVNGQVVQASKRIYSGSYDQLSDYDDNEYLRKINIEFINRGLDKNLILIAGENDKIIERKSSLWEDVNATKKVVNNEHSGLVDRPDPEIFKIILEHK